MRIATIEESRRIDELSQSEFELPGDILMEAAGGQAAREIEQSFFPDLRRGSIGVICGPGNNGGDGLVVARHLHSAGYENLTVFLIAPLSKRTPLFRTQLERCRRQRIEIVDLIEEPQARDRILSRRFLVDAVFGIGLRHEIVSPFLEVIEAINTARVPVASLDTPSGLDADRGIVRGACVRASQTITFGLAKPGFFVSEGPSFVGRLRVLPIGFPRELLRRCATTHLAFGEDLARRFLPTRRRTSNKTHHGHAVVFAGSSGMWGAGLLASSAAYRIGAGYVTLASFEDPSEVLTAQPEILTARAMDEALWKKNRRWKVAAVGPGLGTGDETAELLERLKKEPGIESVVVDADAITCAAERGLFPFPASWIMTPHAGELARVLGSGSGRGCDGDGDNTPVSAREIESDRYRYACEAVAKTGCNVLLKGFRTVIGESRRAERGEDGVLASSARAMNNRAIVILSGNAALAKAGTGDVLTGLIVGLLAQGVPPTPAAATAAYVHGRLADEWVRSGHDRRSLQASDLRENLPELLARIGSSRVGLVQRPPG